MSIFISNDLNTGPNGAAATAAELGASNIQGTGTAVYTNSDPVVGSFSLNVSAAAASTIIVRYDYTAAPLVWHSIYVKPPATIASTSSIATILSGTTTVSRIQINPDRTVKMSDGTTGSNVTAPTANALPAGQWSRIAYKVQPGTTNGLTLRVYTGSNRHGSTPDWSGSLDATILATTVDNSRFGVIAGASGETFGLTRLRLDNAAEPGGVPQVPGTPVITASSGNAQVTVTWPTPADNGNTITGYTLQRKPSGGTFATIASPGAGATTYTDTGLTNGTTYLYRLSATNSAGTSPYSAEASATPSATASAPDAPVLSAVSGNAEVSLSWPTPANNGATITGYTLQRKPSGGTFATIASPAATATTYTDTGLTNGTTYLYRILANATPSNSAYSTEVTANPIAGQTVYPASDVTTAGWSVVGGTGTHASALANTETTSYVQSPSYPAGQQVEKVLLGSLTVPANKAGWGIDITAQGVGATKRVAVTLTQGAVTVLSSVIDLSDVWETYTLTLTTTDAQKVTAGAGGVATDLALSFAATANDTPPAAV